MKPKAAGSSGSTCTWPSRKVVYGFLIVQFVGLFIIVLYNNLKPRFPLEDHIMEQYSDLNPRLQHQDQHKELQISIDGTGGVEKKPVQRPTTMMPFLELLSKVNGSRAAAGVDPENLQLINIPLASEFLPHLDEDPFSLRPAYHMKGKSAVSADVVIGIPTVKREKESYLLITLMHLINNLSSDECSATLIIVFIGETDLGYVLATAKQIEDKFPKQVESGLIEVMSPSSSFYPVFEDMEPTLGDSPKRFKWRTKQNLDTLYLMAYARTRGTYYLMLEDDVIAQKGYMQAINKFTAETSVKNPKWFFIEYCTVGGIGKLFRCSDLIHFITYVQLFYKNMPIDWLLESYLGNRVCSIDKGSKQCGESKQKIRPKYKSNLFKHIGTFSSLKGKMHKVKDPNIGPPLSFYPHWNPPLQTIKTDIKEYGEFTLQRAYNGETYFWGAVPKKGDVVEFWFEEPTVLEGFTFRSGNVEHPSDKLRDAVVEVLPAKNSSSFVQVGVFDEFGLADETLENDLGPLSAIRLKVNSKNKNWVILSEIELRIAEDGAK